MHALKSALHADKFATFWMFPKKFLFFLFCFANDPYTLYKPLNSSTLERFQNK